MSARATPRRIASAGPATRNAERPSERMGCVHQRSPASHRGGVGFVPSSAGVAARAGQRPEHSGQRRPSERPVSRSDSRCPRWLLGNGGGIDVRARAGCPVGRVSFGHDLEELEDRRVSDGAARAARRRLVYVAHGTRGPALPQTPRWPARHWVDESWVQNTKDFVLVNTNALRTSRGATRGQRGRGKQRFVRALRAPSVGAPHEC